MSDPFNNPFGKLQGARDALPEGPKRIEKEAAAAKGPARAVVRMERKGRGGKEVTVVEQLGLPAKQLDLWLKALKQSLGCGGTAEGDTLVLQGDQRDRLPALLEARGVRKITLG
jgi:translation initiation factor 1